MAVSLVGIWRQIIQGSEKSWVLFKNGSCVIFARPTEDIRQQASELMKTWGPVHAGSSAGDFTTISLRDSPGWAVTCHHPDILTYVSPDEVEAGATDLVVGLLGRSKRNQDAEQLEIIHIEAKPPAV